MLAFSSCLCRARYISIFSFVLNSFRLFLSRSTGHDVSSSNTVSVSLYSVSRKVLVSGPIALRYSTLISLSLCRRWMSVPRFKLNARFSEAYNENVRNGLLTFDVIQISKPLVLLKQCLSSVSNRCVIEVFGGIFVLLRCFVDFSVVVEVFVIRLSQISSFFSSYLRIKVPFLFAKRCHSILIYKPQRQITPTFIIVEKNHCQFFRHVTSGIHLIKFAGFLMLHFRRMPWEC